MMSQKYKIILEYCVPWNYLPQAVRATEEVLADYQHLIESFDLITGTRGAFEFRVDGELLFSKQTMQKRHAKPGEILALFRDHVGHDVATYPK